MEILDFILKNFLSGDAQEKFAPVFKTVTENGFDLGKIIKNLDISAILPLLDGLFSAKSAAPPKTETANPLSPVSDVADRDIIFALNRYIAAAHNT